MAFRFSRGIKDEFLAAILEDKVMKREASECLQCQTLGADSAWNLDAQWIAAAPCYETCASSLPEVLMIMIWEPARKHLPQGLRLMGKSLAFRFEQGKTILFSEVDML